MNKTSCRLELRLRDIGGRRLASICTVLSGSTLRYRVCFHGEKCCFDPCYNHAMASLGLRSRELWQPNESKAMNLATNKLVVGK